MSIEIYGMAGFNQLLGWDDKGRKISVYVSRGLFPKPEYVVGHRSFWNLEQITSFINDKHIINGNQITLLGLTEAGSIMGWNRMKTSVYYSRGKLPEPFALADNRPFWLPEQIEKRCLV